MKKNIFIAVCAILMALPASAQYHGRYPSGYIARGGTGRVYDNNNAYYGNMTRTPAYFGLRIGLAESKVTSDDQYLNGSSMKSGLNVGFIAGMQVSAYVPLCLESGLFYTGKGGEGNYSGKKFTYNLNYLEIPFIVKYRAHITNTDFSIQPFFGGYVSFGVGGKIKNFGDREVEDSFDDNRFKRVDAGLRAGIGAQYNIVYLELGYDFGLTNICHDYFDTSHTGSLFINAGVNF